MESGCTEISVSVKFYGRKVQGGPLAGDRVQELKKVGKYMCDECMCACVSFNIHVAVS